MSVELYGIAYANFMMIPDSSVEFLAEHGFKIPENSNVNIHNVFWNQQDSQLMTNRTN